MLQNQVPSASVQPFKNCRHKWPGCSVWITL